MVQPAAGGPGDVSLPMALYQRITGFWVTQALYAAARLGIADRSRTAPEPARPAIRPCCASGSRLRRAISV